MLKNSQSLSLYIPEPSHRPGDKPDFSNLNIPAAGTLHRPDPTADARETRDHAFGLIRVLDDHDKAVGPWNPNIAPETLKKALRTMLTARAFDDKMFKTQRQGKIPFYLKATGEEAVGCAQALALDPEDMCFPTYRQSVILIARGYPLEKMAMQLFGNSADPLKGRHMPLFYSSREHGYFSNSPNLATQYIHAVGWAMASAYREGDHIASAYIGDGATAEGDFHHALTFASVYRVPVILNVVNNQWAISSFQGIANPSNATFAARGIGYGLPTLRVDGNDFLAVYAATAWAKERAKSNLGATLIEHFTYRVEGHSTSDDPSKYRPLDEGKAWPLGDPITRLRRHLQQVGSLSEKDYDELNREVMALVAQAVKKAEEFGTYQSGERPSVSEMFKDVFHDLPWHLRQQRQEIGF